MPLGTSRVAQELRLRASNPRGTGLILSQETKIPHAELYEQERKNTPQRHDKIEKGGGLETDDMAKEHSPPCRLVTLKKSVDV